MKRILTICFALLVVGLANGAHAAAKVHHVVCLKFKSSATTHDINGVEEAFAALKDKVPGIDSLKWGTNVSKEQRNKGFTHCFVLTFKSEKERDAYLEHPEHKAFGKLVGPTVDDVFVIDFVPQKKN
ncbi:MAG TPA: Dabb family protein [Patescibacteria group bacterium]|nr:Dabb family protein [Patescibacteria group bacterium]